MVILLLWKRFSLFFLWFSIVLSETTEAISSNLRD